MTRSMIALTALSLALASATPAAAMSVAECSQRFFTAQKDGSLNGRAWADFRQEVCGVSTGRTPSSVRRSSDLAVPPASPR